jgi:hypothetical protein
LALWDTRRRWNFYLIWKLIKKDMPIGIIYYLRLSQKTKTKTKNKNAKAQKKQQKKLH